MRVKQSQLNQCRHRLSSHEIHRLPRLFLTIFERAGLAGYQRFAATSLPASILQTFQGNTAALAHFNESRKQDF